MTLFVTDDNPLPEGIVSGYFTTKDGCRIRHAHVLTQGRKGTAVLLQGRNETIEKYFETIRDLTLMGFSCATLDWRGQGGSDRLLRNSRAGHVGRFDSYVEELEQFFHEVVLPNCPPPHFILAHSTGGLVTLLALPRLRKHISRAVLLAPLLGLNEQMPQKRIHAAARVLCRLGLGTRHFPGANDREKLVHFETNPVTSDRKRFERNQQLARSHPELFVSGPTVAWVRNVCDAMDLVQSAAFTGANRTPILLIAAGSDRVVSTGAIEHYARRIRSGHCLVIDGAKHELLQEADIYREQVLAAFAAFVSVKTGSEAPSTTQSEETTGTVPDQALGEDPNSRMDAQASGQSEAPHLP